MLGINRIRKKLKAEVDFFTVFFFGTLSVVLLFLLLWYVLHIFMPDLVVWW